MCQETKLQEVEKTAIKDTWSGMPWKDFIQIVTEQGFQMAYQKAISIHKQEEGIEAILYHEDGLLLYATSFHGTLNKAIIDGEMGREAYALAKQARIRFNYYTFNDGSDTFYREVQNGFLQFLKEIKEIPIARIWTENHRILHILNSHEEAAMICDIEDVKFHKQRALQRQKLSKCCPEVKRMAATVLRIPKERGIEEFMLWDSFLETIAEQGFQIGYQNKFIDVDESEQEEVILYRADGLLLYAYSEYGCLAKATLYGEVRLHSKKEQKKFSEHFEVETYSDGVAIFSQNACVSFNRMLKFLKEFELHKEWTISPRSFHLLNKAEQVSLEGSSDEFIQAARITRTKLLQSYIGVREIIGVILEHAVQVPPEPLPARRTPFYVLRKYCMR